MAVLKKILLTGASGFIGFAVLKELLAKGQEVRVLLRPNSSNKELDKLKVEKVKGDLREVASLKKALKGCDILYHVAAHYSFWDKDYKEIYQTNVDGTDNLFSLALKQDVSKVVYTSTVGVLKLSYNLKNSHSEKDLLRFEECKGHYKKSKYLAHQLALGYVQKGLPLVIVQPTAPVGPADFKPTPTGRLIVDFCKKRMPAYTDTGLNLIHVKDVARGHVLAAEKGRIGESYILGNENLSLYAILEKLSRITGISKPHFKMPAALIEMIAYCNEWISDHITHQTPFVSREEASLAKAYMFYNSHKAQKELGLKLSSVDEALAEAVKWFRDHHYV